MTLIHPGSNFTLPRMFRSMNLVLDLYHCDGLSSTYQSLRGNHMVIANPTAVVHSLALPEAPENPNRLTAIECYANPLLLAADPQVSSLIQTVVLPPQTKHLLIDASPRHADTILGIRLRLNPHQCFSSDLQYFIPNILDQVNGTHVPGYCSQYLAHEVTAEPSQGPMLSECTAFPVVSLPS
jgi:hypothetical protein